MVVWIVARVWGYGVKQGIMGKYEVLWGKYAVGGVGKYMEVWGSMKKYGVVWGSMGQYGEVWGSMGEQGVVLGIYLSLFHEYSGSIIFASKLLVLRVQYVNTVCICYNHA